MKTKRVAVDATSQVLAALHTLTFPGDAAPAWREDGLAWITYDGEDPVAFLYAEPITDELWYFSRVGVMPAARGRGLQGKLMALMERALAGTAVVSTTYENPASANRFVARRWKTYIPAYRWGAAGTIYWYKDLRCSKPSQ